MGPTGQLQTQLDDDREIFMGMLKTHIYQKLHYQTRGISRSQDSGGKKKEKKAKPAKKAGGGGMFGKKAKIGAMAAAAGGDPMGGLGALAGGMDAGDMLAQAQEAAAEAGLAGGDEGEEPQGGGDSDMIDDLVSQIPIETYIACRVRPLTVYLEKRAIVMSKRNQMLEFAVVSLQTAGSVLAVIGQADWIVLTVAVSSQCMALIDYFYIPSQLSATNSALEKAHNLLSWWDSLSLVQRKTPKVKLTVSETVENAVLALIAAQTGVSPALPNEQAGEEEEES